MKWLQLEITIYFRVLVPCLFVTGAIQIYAAEMPTAIEELRRSEQVGLKTIVSKWTSERKFAPGTTTRSGFPSWMHDPGFTMPVVTELKFTEGRFHLYEQSEQGSYISGTDEFSGETAHAGHDVAFDGEATEIGSRGDVLSLLKLTPQEWFKLKPEATFTMCDYWESAGWVAPNTHYETLPTSVLTRIVPLVMSRRLEDDQIRFDDTTSTVNGHQCLRATIEQADGSKVLFLDETLRYAVRKSETYNKEGVLIESCSLDDFQTIEEGDKKWWIPQSAIKEFYQFSDWPEKPDKTLFEQTFKLVSATTDRTIDNSEITLIPGDYLQRGTVIADKAHPAASKQPNGVVQYIVPADPSQLDDAIKHAADGTPFVPNGLDTSRVHKMWLIVGTNIVIIVGLVVHWIHRTRTRKST